jgi:hypothetical protein
MAAWPDSVERVVRVLREAKVEARVEEFSEGTPTAASGVGSCNATSAAGCSNGKT